jgi:hypothetical protein
MDRIGLELIFAEHARPAAGVQRQREFSGEPFVQRVVRQASADSGGQWLALRRFAFAARDQQGAGGQQSGAAPHASVRTFGTRARNNSSMRTSREPGSTTNV